VTTLDQIEVMLQPYKFYVPAKDMLMVLQTNRSFAMLALRQVEEVLKK